MDGGHGTEWKSTFIKEENLGILCLDGTKSIHLSMWLSPLSKLFYKILIADLV